MYNYTKSINFHHTPQIIYCLWMSEKKRKKKRKYTIESVLTSHSESCTAYLLIDERTGPNRTMQKLYTVY